MTRQLLRTNPSLAVFDTEQVGNMLQGALRQRLPVADFQDWRSWRRLVVATLIEVRAELDCDLIVPQTVLVKQSWNEIADGLSQRDMALLAFTLDVDPAEHRRRIDTDQVEAEAASWRHQRRADFDAALPWLNEVTNVLNTTDKSPQEIAGTIAAEVRASR